MDAKTFDKQIRLEAFHWLSQQVAVHGDVLPRQILAQGFDHDNVRIPLIGPQGIFKPKILPEIPLSITTAPRGPYDDGIEGKGVLHYRYRGTDSSHRDNVGLRKAMTTKTPLVYFFGIVPGKYMAAWPVFVIGDSPRELTFTVAVDDMAYMDAAHSQGYDVVAEPEAEARRSYITASIRQRLHQRSFRERVLRAYRESCALCRLRHQELLDAAHIIPDAEEEGVPEVRNGIALCKLHHAAFDRFLLGIRPDFVIEIPPAILREKDGPLLLHGLQGLNLQKMVLPRSHKDYPDVALLEKRYVRYRQSL